MKLVDYGLELFSLDNPLYSGHRSSNNRQHHHQLTSSGTSSVSSSVPTLDINNAFGDSPTLRRRTYGQRHSRYVAAGKCTSYCLSCLLRQRVIASLLIVGLTVGITIVIASLVVYRRRLLLNDSLESATNSTDPERAVTSQVYEGRLRIIGGKFGIFLQEYDNKDSSEYRSFESIFIQTIDDVYRRSALADAYSGSHLVSISRGSVVVTFNLYFNENVVVAMAPLVSDDVNHSAEEIESALSSAIVQWTRDPTSGRLASHFIVDRKSLRITPAEMAIDSSTARHNHREQITKSSLILPPATTEDNRVNRPTHVVVETEVIDDPFTLPNLVMTVNPSAYQPINVVEQPRAAQIDSQIDSPDSQSSEFAIERVRSNDDADLSNPPTTDRKDDNVVPPVVTDAQSYSGDTDVDVGVGLDLPSVMTSMVPETTSLISSSPISRSSPRRTTMAQLNGVTTTTETSWTSPRLISLSKSNHQSSNITVREPSAISGKYQHISGSPVNGSAKSTTRSNAISLVNYSTATSTSDFPLRSSTSMTLKTTPTPSGVKRKASSEKDVKVDGVKKCSADEFTCQRLSNYQTVESCVPRRYLCDGKVDCLEGVDEMTCGNRSKSIDSKACLTGYFRCNSGLGIGNRRCLRETSRCDRVRDCLDASDELNCTYQCTESDHFRCESGAISRWPFSGYCLRPNERCNGFRECRDGSDETGCEVGLSTSTKSSSSSLLLSSTAPTRDDVTSTSTVSRCGADEWSCADAAACLPLAFRCDRRRHCADGSDEKNCDFRCPSGSFPCRSGTLDPVHGAGFCVAARAACDGISHCADGSDEDDCNSTCADGYFRCRAGAHVINRQPCVPIEYVCDREQDCADGSDEPPSCNVTCPEQQVACQTGLVARWPFAGYCIERGELCDGMADCQDGSDEINCTSGVGNSSSPIFGMMISAWCDIDQWTCRTTNETLCINMTQLCDQRPDCPDGSDELNCTYACAANHFRCVAAAALRQTTNATIDDNSPSRCFPITTRCDGNVDCADESDEKDCGSKLRTRTSSIEISPTLLACPPFYFRCKNGTRTGLRLSASAGRMCVPDRYRCDRRSDCIDLSDEFNCTYSCPIGQVACTSGALSRWPWRGYCIPTARRCDNRRDCADDSDETGCASSSSSVSLPRCASGQFRCRNGTASVFGGGTNRVCISGRLRCDGVRDCSDGSDETSCELSSFCRPTQFTCRSSGVATIDRFSFRSRSRDQIFCLDASMRCDGIVQCPDASDETGCDVTYTADACKGDFRCVSDSRCIPRQWTCDRELDCVDGSDETNCTYACADDGFACQTGSVNRSPYFGFCIPSSGRCDGSVDCRDGSDETDCKTDDTAAASGVTQPSSTPDSSCPSPTDLRCLTAAASGTDHYGCVPAERRCDRVADCADAVDEIGCGYRCPHERRACITGVVSGWPHRGFCIDVSSWCDGVRHCVDGSDEVECSPSTGCESGYFRCSNETSLIGGKNCIASHAVCNGERDCLDGSDESHCSRLLERATPGDN